MVVETAILVELAGTPDPEFAFALATHDLGSRSGLADVVAAADEWAWDEPVAAAAVAARSRAVAEAAGWTELPPAARYIEARGAVVRGDLDDARALLSAARDGFRAGGDDASVRRTSLGLANIEAATGDLDAARAELLGLIRDGEQQVAGRVLNAKARQNLAAIEIMTGRYERGAALLREAESDYVEAGLRREWIDAVNNRAIALLGLGRTHDATRAIDEALRRLDADEQVHSRAELLDTSARARMLSGRFGEAIEQFEASLRIARAEGLDDRAAATQLGLADLWSTINLTAEAGAAYATVAEHAARTGHSATTGWALLGLGLTGVALRRVDEARRHLTSALDAFESDGQWSGAISAALSLSAIAPDPVTRDADLDRAILHGDPHQRPADQVFIELACFDAGRGSPHLDAARSIVDRLTVPRLRFEVDVRRAAVLRESGELGAAVPVLRRAADLIDSTRGTLASERHRRAFLVDRLAAHSALVEVLVQLGGADDLREAFEVAERARSRALLDSMKGFTARRRSLSDDASTLERLEQFGADLEAMYNGMLGDEEVRGVAPAAADLGAVEQAIERAVGAVAPTAGEPGLATVVPLDAVQDDLRAAEAVMISYHAAGERMLAFVLDGAGVGVHELEVTVAQLADASRRLDAQLARFRAGAAFSERWNERMLAATDSLLADLHAALIVPLSAALAGRRRLVVVAGRELQRIPFAALGSAGCRLLDEVEVIAAPSASAWVHCNRIVPASGRSAVFAVADDRAPMVDVEATAVASTLVDATVLRGPVATAAALLGVVDAPVVHLACHGMFHPDHAMFSALRLGDGWTTAHRLADADLGGSLVTLSACESGRFSVDPGDEPIGLPRALLLAGARDVVASSWLAHDQSTATLMRHFYRCLAAGTPPAGALRRAQLATRAAHPHPFYWAAFTVLGCGWRPTLDADPPLASRPLPLDKESPT